MTLEGLHTSNSPRQIDHPKCNILANDTVVLDVILQNYFKELLLEDVICVLFSSGGSYCSRFQVERTSTCNHNTPRTTGEAEAEISFRIASGCQHSVHKIRT